MQIDRVRFSSRRPDGSGWNAALDSLADVLVARTLDEVVAVLDRAEAAARRGKWVAAVVSYEAAAAFEPVLQSRIPIDSSIPFVWAGVFDRGDDATPPAPSANARSLSALPSFEPRVDVDTYAGQVRTVQEHIRSGDVYQVNLTFPYRSFEAVPIDAYDGILSSQESGYCACLDVDSHLILSFSPELFFDRRGETVLTRPMKGTIGRGRWLDEDLRRRDELERSGKDRAENVMIVDLLRNDLGRLAIPGSVQPRDLFRIERLTGVWQMTSAVEAAIPRATPLSHLFRALFPCGSVTGAPKIRAMEIIAALERRPRGIYTGAIGFLRPGGDCTFNVAIRTMVVDRTAGTTTYGTGAGITLASRDRTEYEECVLKARSVIDPRPSARTAFSLIETIRLEEGQAARVDRHIGRMRASATYYGYHWTDAALQCVLRDVVARHPSGKWRLRLLMSPDGSFSETCTELIDDPTRVRRIAFAGDPVDSTDSFLFNKTTNRAVFEAAARARPDVDDVILWNERGEVTETTIANLVFELDGALVTPALACGLLPGILRAEQIEQGTIAERVITRADAERATRVWMINSLRGWMPAVIVP